MMDRRLIYIPGILIGIVLIGTFGYHFVQPDYSLFDALYMTVITITTIGYGEVRPLTTAGRIFDLGLIALAWLGIFMVARMAGQMIIEGEIVKIFGRRRMDKQLAAISDHYIVCGYGRVGRVICDEFARHKALFVLVERNQEAIDEARSKGYLYIFGDCTQDQVLLSAGIERARGLINAVPDEADAVYTTLSARQHNSDLFIMARADSLSAEQMLRRAGADRVISPQASAGVRMAMAALRPNVVDYITLAAGGDERTGVRMEEIIVSEGSKLSGKSLKEIDIRARYGLNVIGIRKPDGKLIFSPSADYSVQGADTLIMVGDIDQLTRAGELFIKPS
jgi:voltage-gated potassium channel